MTDDIAALKSEWKAANAAIAKIGAERDRLVAPTEKCWQAAWERRNAVEEKLEALGSFLSMCEGCEQPIFCNEPYTCNPDDGIYQCVECSPTWQDLVDHPENFVDGDGKPLTAEAAKAIADAHVAAGGSLADSMASQS